MTPALAPEGGAHGVEVGPDLGLERRAAVSKTPTTLTGRFFFSSND